MEIINWFMENGAKIFEIIGMIGVLATMIVKLTPTKSDDEFVAKVINIVSKFSFIIPNHKKEVDK